MSFIETPKESHFPIQNLPYGIFKRKGTNENPRVGVAIGNQILDLSVIADAGLFTGSLEKTKIFHESTLNAFMGLGRVSWKEARARITQLLSKDEPTLRDNAALRSSAFVAQADAEMILPARIGDYTDFYASKEHASNIGSMWRGKDNALMPNWLHLPVGYHGRSSSVVVSGTPLHRPKGQTRPDPEQPPIFGPSKVIDFELEMGFFVGPSNHLGEPISIDKAEDHIFGLVMLNDWSARDIQRWEYQPLGPFLAKNWGTTISPWVVTLEALEPFRTKGPEQDPQPLEYLRDPSAASFDIQITAAVHSEKGKTPQVLATSNLKYMYWSLKQQLTHHSISGCNMQPGDLLGTGTISGPVRAKDQLIQTPDSFGSLLEITWGGKNAWTLNETNEERKYLQDGDTVTLSGFCQGDGYRVGFGDCVGKLLPARP